MLYPIIPQITTAIANELNLDLLNCEWPKTKKGKSNLKLIEKIMEFNSNVWKKKKDSGISLMNEISGIKIPRELKYFEKDLKECHNLV